ncbi:inositol monophosphatase family protein [Streptomyces pacificus]|uniref:inositol monophosphatase family protein n=1 Tax=Streptomyces pacificus TaxID=2705029 RepID=UPI00156443D7|nr:inositol monophosphatase family protein [Streptomyces pacificus]
MAEIERFAITMAQRAATEIRATARRTYRVSRKTGPEDLLTEADLRAESVITDLLSRTRPADAVLAEESGYRPGHSGVTWVVDPLDGTANFVRASPHYAVSIAAVSAAGCLAAAIVRPADGQWLALLDGALNGDFTRDPPAAPNSARVSVALPHGAAELVEARAILGLVGERYEVERTGSAACDLLRAATGALDAHVSVALPWWDTAAGHALVHAGGRTVMHRRSPRRTRIDISGRPEVVHSLARLLAEHSHVSEGAP